MFTNLNITDYQHTYNFAVEYDNSDNHVFKDMYYINTDDGIGIYDEINTLNIIRYENRWEYMGNGIDAYDIKFDDSYTPKISKIKIYFPNFSPDIYKKGIKYVFSANTWVAGKKVTFFTKLFNILDLKACEKVTRLYGHNYYECIEFDMIDPYEFMYHKGWSKFRKELGEEDNANIGGSVIYFTLHLLQENNGGFIEMEGFNAGQNSLLLSKTLESNMHLNLVSNIEEPLYDEKTNESIEPYFKCSINFNKYYNDFQSYLKDTYMIKEYDLTYTLVIGKNDDVYEILTQQTGNDLHKSPHCIFTKSIISSNGNFTNGNGWVPGIFVVCSVDIYGKNEYGDVGVISLISNKLPFNEDVYRYFVNSGDEIEQIHHVKLNLVNMNVYNVNTVNKIENNIVQAATPTNPKSNIVQPVFFRTVESSNIIIHPTVSETICINLDQYKSQVQYFALQIEDIIFQEVGRNSYGVLFKILGKKLPNKINNGNYYVLNQDLELVTLGKYTYSV